MNVHIVRVLSFVALSMITNMALAEDEATLSAIDSKATAAKSKADGNNSRIQGLEIDLTTETANRTAADAVLEQEIVTIELMPGPQGLMGLPGADTPDRTADLCALYKIMSGLGMLGDIEIPDYCFVVCPCAEIYAAAVDFYEVQGGNLGETWLLCDAIDPHQFGEAQSDHVTNPHSLGLVSVIGGDEGQCDATVRDNNGVTFSDGLLYEPVGDPSVEHNACAVLQGEISAANGGCPD